MVKTVVVKNRADFRNWLEKNHKSESKVTVILYKKHTGKTALTHHEMIEEAICFGWIDTTVKRLDEDKYIRNFSKRTEKSRWSDNTIRYAGELKEKGLMSEQGLKYFELGLKKPTHDAGIPKNPEISLELADALAKDRDALKFFDSLSPSRKKAVFRWILRAKLPATRKKRIENVVEMAGNGESIF